MKKEEHYLQSSCVKWFDLQYPKKTKQLFAVPNGGKRNIVVAKQLKAEGVRAGVADLILLTDNGKVVFIEMKTDKGRQQLTQIHFQNTVTMLGHLYVIVRTFEEFKIVIEKSL